MMDKILTFSNDYKLSNILLPIVLKYIHCTKNFVLAVLFVLFIQKFVDLEMSS